MKKINLTIPVCDQIIGNTKLEIFEKNKEIKKSKATDFSILLGASVDKLQNGSYWCQNCKSILADGRFAKLVMPSEHNYGVRLIVPYSDIENDLTNKLKRTDDILEVEYGEYPQSVCPLYLSFILEKEYLDGLLKETGKIYTIDSEINHENDHQFKNYTEYQFNGGKYIRFIGIRDAKNLLSDGNEVRKGKIYWVKVEPIKWLVDEKFNVAIMDKLIFSNVPYTLGYDEAMGEFDIEYEESNLENYIDKYISKDIIPSQMVPGPISNIEKDILTKQDIENFLIFSRDCATKGINFNLSNEVLSILSKKELNTIRKVIEKIKDKYEMYNQILYEKKDNNFPADNSNFQTDDGLIVEIGYSDSVVTASQFRRLNEELQKKKEQWERENRMFISEERKYILNSSKRK